MGGENFMKKLDVKKTMNGFWGFVKKQQVGIVAGICVIIVIAILCWLSSLGLMGWPIGTGLEGKTIWDWLQLAIIPVVLAGGALLFNRTEKKNEITIAETRKKSEQEIAKDRQREQALQNYIDKMTELLLQNNLRGSQVEDEVRVVARTRTLTTLGILDGMRKGTLLRFLFEAGLINKENVIVNLKGADLKDANLWNASLRSANLEHTHLEGAILLKAGLMSVNLEGANLSGACLISANLQGADLLVGQAE